MFETDAAGDPVEVADLDATALLAFLDQRKLDARIAERDKLRAAAHWCVLHPATAETGTATWGGASLLGGDLDGDESLGGDGTPAVSAFAPEPLAAVLGVATITGMKLIADALDLQHRLPRIWRLVESLAVEPYKARHVAQATHRLSRDAAAYVDEQLAPRLASCSWKAIETAVAHAIAKHHPELFEQREKTGKQSWHVTLRHPAPAEYAGTSWLDITGDTLDLTAFHDLVCDHAAQLKALGDTDELEVRKAKALGVIASQQAQLDLRSLLGSQGEKPAAEHATVPTRPRKPKTRFYLHLNLADLATHGCSGSPDLAAGTVERLGAATITRIKDWVGHSQVTVQPVLDLGRGDAIDGHEPPTWMRELVILRDGHCVFPWCPHDARTADLDHIDPYVPIDEGGPPGQTRPENLAPLCRRHHRAKTSRRWRYRRRRDSTYEWHGPHGRAYLVTPHGTIQLTSN
ncbi:HNH endonuclease signature motif containing protein [Nocardioides ungokensis]